MPGSTTAKLALPRYERRMLSFTRALSGCAALSLAKLAGYPVFDRSTRVQFPGTARAKPLRSSCSSRQPAGTGTGEVPVAPPAAGTRTVDWLGPLSSVPTATAMTPSTTNTISRIHPARDQLRWRLSNASASRGLYSLHAHSLPLMPAKIASGRPISGRNPHTNDAIASHQIRWHSAQIGVIANAAQFQRP